MKKVILFGMLASALCFAAYADGTYTETETIHTSGTITIDTVRYTDAPYVAPRRHNHAAPCRAATSIELARAPKCGTYPQQKLAPVRVKTYTEVIDHYQVYTPVVSYRPTGTYTTRRYIDAQQAPCGTCAR